MESLHSFQKSLDEKVRIVSGQAEQEIQEQKLAIAAELQRSRETLDARHRKQVEMADRVPGLLPTVAALTRHEVKNYSIANAIRNSLSNTPGGTLEREVSHGIAADLKQTPKGLWVPLRIVASGMDTKSNAAGRYLTGTTVASDIIDYMTNATKVLALGGQLITGVRFSPQFAVEASPVAAQWVSENNGDVAQVDPSFTAKTVQGKTLQGTTLVSRQLLQQSSADLEMWLRRKLGESHALALDLAAVHGSGLTSEPIGLLSTSGIYDVPVGANGGPLTAAHLIELERLAGDGDAAKSGFLTNPLQRSKLRSTPEMVGGTTPVWKDGTLLGHRTEVSGQVSATLVKGSSTDCSAMVYSADWSRLLLFEFAGAVDVLVDEYSAKRKGMVELSSFGCYDVLVQQPGRFAVCRDAR